MIIKSEAFLQFRKYSQYRNTTMIHRSVTFLIVIFFVFLESSKHDSRKDLNNGKKHSENIEANGLQIKTARITVRALCYVISISSIGYLLFLIRQMITNFNNSFDNSVSESTEKTNRSSISSSTSAQHQTKKDEMIDCLKDINRLYLKSLFDPLAISGIMNIGYITSSNIYIDAAYSHIIVWAFFDLFLVAMGVVLIQSLTVHCFSGLFDKIPLLHLRISSILNWNIEWDGVLAEEMVKPPNIMLPVCKALKILQWIMYFSIVSIAVICIAQFS